MITFTSNVTVNNRKITISSIDNGQVISEVADTSGTSSRTTVLFEYSGEKKTDEAIKSARNLFEVINNRDIYDGKVEISGSKIIVDNSWVPFNTTTVFNASFLPEDKRQNALTAFFYNLVVSGIMPGPLEASMNSLQKIQGNAPLFRDHRLAWHLDLASAYAQTGNLSMAEEEAKKITGFSLSITSARPYSYDDAVFLMADLRQWEAVVTTSPDQLASSILLLNDNVQKLKDEPGYKRKYYLEHLNKCGTAREYFPSERNKTLDEFCTPKKVATYYQNAAWTYNSFYPSHADNYIYNDACLGYGRFLMSCDNFDGANIQFNNILDNIAFIRGRNSVGQLLAIDIRKLLLSDQFTAKNFYFGEALAYKAKGDAERMLAYRCADPKQKKEHLEKAAQFYEKAIQSGHALRQNNPTTFYTGLIKEREAYFEILADSAEALIQLFYVTNDRSLFERIREYTGNVRDFYGDSGIDPANTSYLKVLFIEAAILEVEGAPKEERLMLFDKIINAISLAQLASGGTTPVPFQQYMLSKARIKHASLIFRTENSASNETLAELASNASKARADLAAIIIKMPRLANEANMLIAESLAIEVAIFLKKGNEAEAEKLFKEILGKYPQYAGILAPILLSILESDIGKIGENDDDRRAKIDRLISICDKVINALDKAGALKDDYFRLSAMLSKTTLLIMRNNQKVKNDHTVMDAEAVLDIAGKIFDAAKGSVALTNEQRAYFTLYARLRKAEAWIQHNDKADKLKALDILKEIEKEFLTVITPNILNKLESAPTDIANLQMRVNRKENIEGDKKGVLLRMEIIKAVLTENRNTDNSKEIDQVIARIDEIIALINTGNYDQASLKAKEVYQSLKAGYEPRSSDGGYKDIKWGIRSFKSEVYHSLTIVYSLISGKNVIMTEYANSACVEGKRSKVPYDNSTRIEKLFKMLKRSSDCECDPNKAKTPETPPK